VIKKFSASPSSVQNKIKIVFASYSSKAQNTTCAMCLLAMNILCISAYEQSVCQMGVKNANTKLYGCETAKIYFTTRYSG